MPCAGAPGPAIFPIPTVLQVVSLLKISSEPEFEQLQELIIELGRDSEMGCELNQKRPPPVEIATFDETSSDDAFRLQRNYWRAGNRGESGSEAFVAVMQATDFGMATTSPIPRGMDRTRVGAILVERKMSPGALVIVDVRGEDAAQMAFVEDHDMIQTLAANRTDDALDVSVLPG